MRPISILFMFLLMFSLSTGINCSKKLDTKDLADEGLEADAIVEPNPPSAGEGQPKKAPEK